LSWYAIDTLGEAYEETKEFLLPFDLRLWLKIAFVLFFVGGYSSFPTSFGNTGGGMGGVQEEVGETQVEVPETPDAVLEELSNLITPLVLSILLAVLIVGVIYSYLSSVFTFVFYRSVQDAEVRLRAGVKRYAYDGLKYFVFNLLMLVLWLASLALAVAAFFNAVPVGLSVLAALVPLWVLLWLVSFYVRSLTVPEMVAEDAGFVESLKRTYGYVRGEPKQAAVFLVASIVIGIAAAAVLSVAVAAISIIAAIPLVILGVVLYFISPLLVAVPAIVGVLFLLVALFAVSVPVQTYVFGWILNVHSRFSELE
jgi:MFS family permease